MNSYQEMAFDDCDERWELMRTDLAVTGVKPR